MGSEMCIRDRYNNELKNLIRDWGLFGKESYKDLQLLPTSQLKAFIQGFFNGDGSISVGKRTGRDTEKVDVTFCIGISKRLAEEIQFMLWRLGINSKVNLQKNMARSCGIFYTVRVYRRDDKIKLIQMLDDRKYPQKFRHAMDVLRKTGKVMNGCYDGDFVQVKSIEQYGRDKFVQNLHHNNHSLPSQSSSKHPLRV